MGLQSACKGGHKDLINFFIDKGAHDYECAIEGAAEGGHKDILDIFMTEFRWMYEAVDIALPVAAKYGHIELVKHLLAKDSSWSLDSALEGAVLGGHKDILEVLIEQTKEQGQTILNRCMSTSASQNNREMIEICAREGASDWRSATVAACRYGHMDLMQDLLQAEAWWSFDSLLTEAAKGGHRHIIDWCIQVGASDWNDAIIAAISESHNELVKFFLEKGANNWEDCLSAASESGNIELMGLFISKGATDWNAALSKAALGGDLPAIELLVKQGANDWLKGLHCSVSANKTEAAKYFLEKGVNINLDPLLLELFEQWKPHKYLKTMGLLIDYGASWSEAMKIAMERNCDQVINFLAQKKLDDFNKKRKKPRLA